MKTVLESVKIEEEWDRQTVPPSAVPVGKPVDLAGHGAIHGHATWENHKDHVIWTRS